MTDPDADLIEAMARAICAAQGHDPNSDFGLEDAFEPAWQNYTAEARAALAVARPGIWREAMEAAAEHILSAWSDPTVGEGATAPVGAVAADVRALSPPAKEGAHE